MCHHKVKMKKALYEKRPKIGKFYLDTKDQDAA